MTKIISRQCGAHHLVQWLFFGRRRLRVRLRRTKNSMEMIDDVCVRRLVKLLPYDEKKC